MSKPLHFDGLYKIFCTSVSKIVDHRGKNISYSLSDVLKSGFALFSLKSPSLLSYESRSISETKNFSTIYKIDQIPSDTSMRETLDKVEWRSLLSVFSKLYKSIKKNGDIDNYRILGNRLLLSIDGVHHFSSNKIKCKHCLTKNHSNGDVSYHHCMLCAVLVHPDQSEVIPLSCEPIINKDGDTKNDCEQNASKRLITNILNYYKREKFIIVEDALYGSNPNITLIKDQGWSYILRVKKSSHKTLFDLYEGRLSRDQMEHYVVNYQDQRHAYWYMNGVSLNNQKNSQRVHFIHYEHIDKKGQKKSFQWVTDIKITKRNVGQICQAGRSRWKIENETFNTLKNQGYNFNHNYGHGHEKLASVMAILMLLAFTIDQIQQMNNALFRSIVKHLKSRKKLWEAMRNVFSMITVYSMEILLITVAQNWSVKINDP